MGCVGLYLNWFKNYASDVFTEPKVEPTIYDNSQNIDFFKQKFNSKDASPFIKK